MGKPKKTVLLRNEILPVVQRHRDEDKRMEQGGRLLRTCAKTWDLLSTIGKKLAERDSSGALTKPGDCSELKPMVEELVMVHCAMGAEIDELCGQVAGGTFEFSELEGICESILSTAIGLHARVEDVLQGWKAFKPDSTIDAAYFRGLKQLQKLLLRDKRRRNSRLPRLLKAAVKRSLERDKALGANAREAKILKEWEEARKKGISRKDFAASKKMTLKRFLSLQACDRMAKIRAGAFSCGPTETK